MTDYRMSHEQLNRLTVEQLVSLNLVHRVVAASAEAPEGTPPYQFFWNLGMVNAGDLPIDWPRLIRDAYQFSNGSPVGWAMKAMGGTLDPAEFNRQYNRWFEKVK